MITLAIEASNKSLSIALFENDTLINDVHMENTLQHSVHLALKVEEVFENTKYTIQMLNRIVLSIGPGSYTGLRIGVTFAKTLAQALSIPIVPVSSLKVLAQASDEDALIVPFFDARRQNVYVGYYQNNEAILPDEHLSMISVLDKVKDYQNIIFISPDMSVYEEIILQHLPHAKCVNAYPMANVMGRFIKEKALSSHEVLPVYLKLAEAEETYRALHGIVATNDLVERRPY